MSTHADSGPALIWTPFDTMEEARNVANAMVGERLVACANIVPGIISVFRYEGKVQSAEEIGVLFKTDARLLDRATARLAELHPYDTPAICGWTGDSAPPETREWLAGLMKES